MKELTIQEACTAPANFMYVWASDSFLNAIDRKHANVIRGKKANQIKLLALSAERYLGSTDRVTEYYSAIKQAFVDTYGMTPAKALNILASGGSVAGKNWNEGMYGIGALNVSDFNGYAIDDEKITVRESDGHILMGATDITDESKTVYQTVNKKTIPFQLFSKTQGYSDVVFMSQYNKLKKKYYAQSYADGQSTYSARTGSEISGSDSADIWGEIILCIEQFLTWVLSLFGSGKQTITASNTLPSQSADGFATGANSEAGLGMLLFAAAAGTFLMGGSKKKKSNK